VVKRSSGLIGVLGGQVVDAATRAPIAGVAVVVANLEEIPAVAADEEKMDSPAMEEMVTSIAGEAALNSAGSVPAWARMLWTNEDGEFPRVSLEPGAYLVAAAHRDYLTSVNEVTVARGEPLPHLGIDLQRLMARIRGKVQFAGGPPGPSSVHALGADGRMQHVQVAPDGSFELDEVPPGNRTVVLRASDPSGEPIEITRSLEIKAGDDIDMDLEDLSETLTLEGAASGAIEPGEAVFLFQDTGAATTGRDTRLRSDGTFRFAGVEPGSYVLVVGPLMREIDLASEADGHVEVVVPQIALRGRIVDTAGQPIPSARISSVRVGASLDPAVLGRFSLSAESDADGLFVLEPLDLATYAVEVQAAGFVTQITPITTESAGLTTEVRLQSAGG
jgi:hypothetical protein